MKLRAPAVKEAALELGLKVHQPVKVKTGNLHEWLRERSVDIAVVLAYGRILPQAVLDAPTRGCVNLHASLLPRFRGAAPIQHAIWSGDTTTGISLMQMEAGLLPSGAGHRTGRRRGQPQRAARRSGADCDRVGPAPGAFGRAAGCRPRRSPGDSRPAHRQIGLCPGFRQVRGGVGAADPGLGAAAGGDGTSERKTPTHHSRGRKPLACSGPPGARRNLGQKAGPGRHGGRHPGNPPSSAGGPERASCPGLGQWACGRPG